MASIETKVIDKDDRWEFKYLTNTIVIGKNDHIKHRGYLNIIVAATAKEDQEKGYFKKNTKNILEYIKGKGFKGLVVKNYAGLSAMAKATVKTGVKHGWIKMEGDQPVTSIFKIDNID